MSKVKSIYKIEPFGEYVDLYCNSPDTGKPVFRLSVKPEYLKLHPEVEALPLEEFSKIFNEFKAVDYFHNPVGSAIERLVHTWDQADKTEYTEYWINGKKLTGDEVEKIKHSQNFNKKVNDFIGNESMTSNVSTK